MTTTISLRDPGELVAAIPYQLGYHPRRCVVVVALRTQRVVFVARSDLPPARDAVPAAVAAVGRPLSRESPDAVLLVGYEDVPGEAVPLLEGFGDLVDAEGIEVLDALAVRHGRRYSLHCTAPCCPPEGVALPSPAEVPGVAELVALGCAPLTDRAAVDRSVAADDSLPPPPGRPWRGRSRPEPPSRRETVEAWAALLRAGGPGGVRRVGRRSAPPSRTWVGHVVTAAAGLADVPLRDALIARLVPGVLPFEDCDLAILAQLDRRLPEWVAPGQRSTGAEPGPPVGEGAEDPGERRALLEVLRAACRAVPDTRPREAAAMCTVTAHVAWSGGDGAVARAALDRALRLVPDYRLAVLLATLLDRGIRPPGGRASRQPGESAAGSPEGPVGLAG